MSPRRKPTTKCTWACSFQSMQGPSSFPLLSSFELYTTTFIRTLWLVAHRLGHIPWKYTQTHKAKTTTITTNSYIRTRNSFIELKALSPFKFLHATYGTILWLSKYGGNWRLCLSPKGPIMLSVMMLSLLILQKWGPPRTSVMLFTDQLSHCRVSQCLFIIMRHNSSG